MKKDVILNQMKESWQEFLCGNDTALASLYEQLFQPLLFVAICKTKDTEVAADIVSELFLSFLEIPPSERREKWKDINDVQAFLAVAVRNKSLDHIKQKKNRNRILIENGFHLVAIETNDLDEKDQLNQSLDELSKDEKQLYCLHLEGYQNNEISEKFNCITTMETSITN